MANESLATDKIWTVYRHTSPSGKCYIGITSYKNMTVRWGEDGKRYLAKRKNNKS